MIREEWVDALNELNSSNVDDSPAFGASCLLYRQLAPLEPVSYLRVVINSIPLQYRFCFVTTVHSNILECSKDRKEHECSLIMII
jgi:hypothetical protein